MRLDELRPTENVDDQRGRFGGYGPHLAVGGGGLGLVAVVIISLLFGVNPAQLLNGDSGGTATEQTGGATGPRSDDAAFQFGRKIVGSAEDVWSPILQARGVEFTPATFTVYDSATSTGCGEGESSMGPFYCSADSHIYLDLSFFNELADRFGAPGQFAQAYVIAHEYGHHIQNLLGTSAAHSDHATGAAGDSVRTELQADCYAGVWGNHAQRARNILEPGDVDEALNAASAIGDDKIQKATRGYVVPESFTHGSSAQRQQWFRRGFESGKLEACDTFASGNTRAAY